MIIGGYDTETTGLQWGEHRIIELSLVRYNAQGLKLDSWTQRINPKRSIEAKALAVHKITERMLSAEPVWEDVAPDLARRLAEIDLLVAHNGDGFDFPFTNHELARVGQPTIVCKTFDTMVNGRWATHNGKVPNLGELCFAAGIAYDPSSAHSAEYDTDVMMQSFFKARDWGFFTP